MIEYIESLTLEELYCLRKLTKNKIYEKEIDIEDEIKKYIDIINFSQENTDIFCDDGIFDQQEDILYYFCNSNRKRYNVSEIYTTITSNMKFVSYDDTNEDNDWMCYEDGTSKKTIWTINNIPIIVKDINHSSKHTYTHIVEIKYNNTLYKLSRGSYSNDTLNTEFNYTDILNFCKLPDDNFMRFSLVYILIRDDEESFEVDDYI